MFYVPDLMSIFRPLGRLSKESVQVRVSLLFFVTNLFLRRDVISRMPNPQFGEPPLVVCPRLLVQYIRCYSPLLLVVPSIRNPRTRHAVVTRGLS
jgi:hypothetical protein